MCSSSGVECNPYMIQYGCLVMNAAHSWREGYLSSDFYERNQMAMDIISVRAPSLPSTSGVAVISPTKRGDFSIDEEPVPVRSGIGDSPQGDNTVVVSVGSPPGVSGVGGVFEPDDDAISGGPVEMPTNDSSGSGDEGDKLTPFCREGRKESPHTGSSDFDLLCATFGRGFLDIIDRSLDFLSLLNAITIRRSQPSLDVFSRILFSIHERICFMYR